MLFEVNKNGRSATSGVGAIAVSASAVKHNAGRDAVFNATLNANKIKVFFPVVNSFGRGCHYILSVFDAQKLGIRCLELLHLYDSCLCS